MIITEKATNKVTTKDSMSICDGLHTESFNLERHWQVIDKITNVDGSIETREYFNTVVGDCSKLIACLMKAQAGYAGIGFWAVGKGDAVWSNDNPPSPSVNDTKLLVETYRKAIAPADITFLDANNAVTATVTNRLQISVTFLENEANGELREFGLFGGTATATANSGLMINRKIHPLIYKTSGMRVDRIIRIIF